MKRMFWALVFISVSFAFGQTSSSADKIRQQKMTKQEAEVKRVIERYFEAFNTHSSAANDEITTEDWYHINPSGEWKKGRAEVTAQLREVHATFLKGVKMKLEDLDIRFAAPEVAVVTVTNSIDTYILPNGEKHENERQIKTIVVVKRGGKWQIIQDQNTIIGRR